jgi:hypothetical protein
MSTVQRDLDWLLENAGSIIRYRTITEFIEESNSNKIELFRNELLSEELVHFWLENLLPSFDKNVMHSGKSEAFENVMGKLYEFGLRKGIRALDEKTEPFHHWLEQQIHLPNEGYYSPFSVFYRTIVAAFLSMTGYSNAEAVKAWILKRLDTIYSFVKEGDFDIYIPHDSFSSFPKVYRCYPLLNPVLYPDGEMKLPWIHDINAFLHSSFIMEDSQLTRKVEVVVDFILSPDYQKLHPDYGVIRSESGRYYVMGWCVHLPGYLGLNLREEDFGRLLLLLNLLSRSKTAREHSWFKRSFASLKKFRSEDGLIAFPRRFLPEKKFGYWVSGSRMGLETNRRVQQAIVCESIFRYLEIALRTAGPKPSFFLTRS